MIRVVVDVRIYRTYIWWLKKDVHFGAYSIEDVNPNGKKIIKRQYSELYFSNHVYFSTAETLAVALTEAKASDVTGTLEIVVSGIAADEIIASITTGEMWQNFKQKEIIETISEWKKTRGDVIFVSGRHRKDASILEYVNFAADMSYGDEFERGYNHLVVSDDGKSIIGKPELRSKNVLKMPGHVWV